MDTQKVIWFLKEFQAAGQDQLDDGGVEIYGEDDKGNEGSSFITVQEISLMSEQCITELAAKLNEIKEIVSRAYVNERDRLIDLDDILSKIPEQSSNNINVIDDLQSKLNHVKEVLNTVLYGTVFDKEGNRDPDGLIPFKYTEKPTELLVQLLKELSK